MRETYECVGIGKDDANRPFVVLSTELQTTWLTPQMAKTLAIQMMLCADRILQSDGNDRGLDEAK